MSIRVLLKSHHLRSCHLCQNYFTTNYIPVYINRQSSMPLRRGSVVPSADRGENRAFHRVGGWHTGNPSSSAGGIYRLREVLGGVSYSLYFDKWFCLTRQWPVKHLDNREVSSAVLLGLARVFACQTCAFISRLSARLSWDRFTWLKTLVRNRGTGLPRFGTVVLYLQEYFLIWIGQDRNSGWVSPIKIHRFVTVGVTTFCCILVMSYWENGLLVYSGHLNALSVHRCFA